MMYAKRRHERLPLTADLIIRSDDQDASKRFAGKVFNLSRKGAAVFSRYDFRAGQLVELELILPIPGTGIRRVVLYGVICYVRPQDDGNLLGIEFQAGEHAGDHAWLAEYLGRRAARAVPPRGFTLMETSIALVIICLLVTMAAPIYVRAMEQARVDSAAGTLRAIWSAQRIYWLEYRAFAPDLATLRGLDLVNADIVNSQSNPKAAFVYRISSADAESFSATALRNGSGVWIGQLWITEAGQLSGSVTGRGVTLTPPS